MSLIKVKLCHALLRVLLLYSLVSKISSDIQIFKFGYLPSGHYFYVKMNMRIRDYFSQPTGVRSGNTALYNVPFPKKPEFCGFHHFVSVPQFIYTWWITCLYYYLGIFIVSCNSIYNFCFNVQSSFSLFRRKYTGNTF